MKDFNYIVKSAGRIVEQVLTFGMADTFANIGKVDDGIIRVAAGDPALPIQNSTPEYEVPDSFEVDGKSYKKADFDSYLVTGNSMSPRGIKNGDFLLVKRNEEAVYNPGDYLIIKVDLDYYKNFNPKTVTYDYKLRKALLKVDSQMTVGDIVRTLKTTHFELNIEEYQKKMEGKFNKARLAYPDEELMLSITYHDGHLCYSFHPVRLIKGKAAFRVSRELNGKSVVHSCCK